MHLLLKLVFTQYRVVLANGTTRLQLDIIKSSGLSFHTLFSSQLLQATKVSEQLQIEKNCFVAYYFFFAAKPSPDIYLKALDLINMKPSQVAMVAAHAYDLRAAGKL